ncbi:MAG TPA: 2,3-butanediol dehydrogenase [Acidimicrobiia bacterium]|nr:2,3-butanediol dehydrogenase [Acidimicrobiia bacterium]
MLSARLHGRRDVRIDDVPEPDPAAGEVKIRVAHNGICGTDLHEFYTGPNAVSDVPHRLTGAVLPQALGHEFAGVVTTVGDGVSAVRAGDRVCVEPLLGCGVCSRCAAGAPEMCDVIASIGLSAAGGGLSEYCVVPAHRVHVLPQNLSLVQGALVEPMSVAFNGVLRARAAPGTTAVVFGAGPIGIGAFLGLQVVGVRPDDIVVVEPSPTRRASIERLGASNTLDPTAVDVVGELLSWTKGRGADAVLECSGSPAALAIAPVVAGLGRRVVVVALFEEPVPFNPGVLLRGAEVVGSLGYAPGVFGRVIDAMAAGHYPSDGWVEHIALAELVEAGFEALRAGRKTKVLVDLSGEA